MSPAEQVKEVVKGLTGPGRARKIRKYGSVVNSGVLYSVLVFLATQGGRAMDRVDATFAKHEAAFTSAQKLHAEHTEKIIAAHQQEIRSVIEQWKQDRAMIVDLLKDGRLDRPVSGEGSSTVRRAVTELAHAQEPVE